MTEQLWVKQTQKGLYSAAFDILLEGREKRGSISMKGTVGIREGRFQIQYDDCYVQLCPIRRREAMKLARPLIKRSPFRPYTVLRDGDSGILFCDQVKTGFMKAAGYHLLSLGDSVYYLYYVGLGKKGICAPIYQNDRCVAEIRKDCTVTDDLHEFNILIYGLSEKVPLIILCCYMYMTTYYRAGEKVLHGVQKNVITTKNEYLLSKCKILP